MNVDDIWFQQDGATCHTSKETVALLKEMFNGRIISRGGDINWPPRSCCCLARNRDEPSVWRIIVINLFNYTWPPDRGTGPLARTVPPVERSRARWKVTRQHLGKTQKWGFSNVKQQSGP
ncbi:hypothetical protein WH47_07057 [Habropoda laboriosa]|uniref:Histone-lysine N-methyltransferase SETMAR n=1 Tax=Habropoda laboriosa TaxID=597456 RepID=A0A0L7RFY3_9HYME|nr:hypothetical protein WH47_07057 [Habropoda laboriosa]